MVVELKDKQNSGFHRLAASVYQHRTNFTLRNPRRNDDHDHDGHDGEGCSKKFSQDNWKKQNWLCLASAQDESALVSVTLSDSGSEEMYSTLEALKKSLGHV